MGVDYDDPIQLRLHACLHFPTWDPGRTLITRRVDPRDLCGDQGANFGTAALFLTGTAAHFLTGTAAQFLTDAVAKSLTWDRTRPDRRIRTVDAWTTTTELTRPITAISLLPKDDSC